MARAKGPEFTRFFKPIIRALKELGGSSTAAETIDRAVELLDIPEEEQNEMLESGVAKVRNQAQWAKFYLVQDGLVGSSKRGVWHLTEKGTAIDPTTYDFVETFKAVQRKYQSERKVKSNTADTPPEVDQHTPSENYQEELLTALQELSPDGFERLCQQLLRESGFERVVVTGRSGDGGIDGIGVLQVNHFVSFNVLFQCKRYTGSVAPSQIRDFRGAMQGRADKGIIITTGTFTVQAKQEARRDGAPPIELVDGSDLVDLCEKLEFCLIPRTTYDVDQTFLNQFR